MAERGVTTDRSAKILFRKETAMTMPTLDDIRELAQQLRVDSVRCSTAAGADQPLSLIHI